MKCRLLLNVVIGQGSAILQLLTSENQSLLVRRNALLVLDFALNGLNAVTGLDIQRNGLPRECLYKYLHLENLLFLKRRVFVALIGFSNDWNKKLSIVCLGWIRTGQNQFFQ